MQHAGLKDITALKGGLRAWESANYPIVKEF